MDSMNFGWIPYLNLRPLKVELGKICGDHFVSKEGHPREVNQWLAKGEVNLAPSSSVNLLDNPHLKMAFPLGVASEGEVQSVYIGIKNHQKEMVEHVYSRLKDLNHQIEVLLQAPDWSPLEVGHVLVNCAKKQTPFIKTPAIKYTPASAASTALSKVFMNLWFGEARNNLENQSDADSMELVIGDEALARRCEFSEILDLGRCWKLMTGLPFVFAVWQTNLPHISEQWMGQIMSAALKSQENMSRHPDLYYPSVLPKDILGNNIDLDSYWKAIHYQLTSRHLKSLELFLKLRELLG